LFLSVTVLAHPVIIVNIYTVGCEKIVDNIIRIELSTEQQLNATLHAININYTLHPKFFESPIRPALDNIIADSEILRMDFSGILQYCILISDGVANYDRKYLFRTDAGNFYNNPNKLDEYIIGKLNEYQIKNFSVLVKGRSNAANELLLRSLSTGGKLYNLTENDFTLILNEIKTGIDRSTPVAIHIILDHSNSLQDTVNGVTVNLTHILQEIWRYYQDNSSEVSLKRFLEDYFIEMPSGYYEIGDNVSSFTVLHTVYLTKYRIMTAPVTQKLFGIYLEAKDLPNPSKNLDPDAPQTNISYNGYGDFIRFLNGYFKTDGFFIPTEEEEEAYLKTNPQKLLSHGNPKTPTVTSSFYGEYIIDQVTDPKGNEIGTHKVIRGYYDDSEKLLPSRRGRIEPDNPSPLFSLRLGFREGGGIIR
jgi:hypothetical protein